MDVRLTTVGLKEIDEVFKGMPLQITHRVMQAANADAAKVLVNKAKSLAPVRRGVLVNSIGTIKPTFRRSNEIGEVHTGPRRGRYKGNHAHLVEYGTARRRRGGIMPKKPFMKPAYLATQNQILTHINEKIGAKLSGFMRRTLKKGGLTFV